VERAVCRSFSYWRGHLEGLTGSGCRRANATAWSPFQPGRVEPHVGAPMCMFVSANAGRRREQPEERRLADVWRHRYSATTAVSPPIRLGDRCRHTAALVAAVITRRRWLASVRSDPRGPVRRQAGWEFRSPCCLLFPATPPMSPRLVVDCRRRAGTSGRRSRRSVVGWSGDGRVTLVVAAGALRSWSAGLPEVGDAVPPSPASCPAVLAPAASVTATVLR
jgi:hypothetical protein